MSGFSGKQTGDSFVIERNSDKVDVMTIDENGGMSNYATAITTIVATGSLTQQDNAGRINLLGEVGGNALVTLTLPPAEGTGACYKFIISVVNTSSYVIKVADASDTIDGSLIALQDAADTLVGWETAATTDTITLNGTTKGGASIGDEIELTDIASNQWAVKGCTTATGTEVTPFSATV